MNTETKRVVGYVRGSTEEQQHTLEAQRVQIEAYCAYKRLEIAEIFVDEGEHGWVSFYERPAAARMLSCMSELNATEIIITKLDRGFRDALDCLFTIDQLKKRGIGLHLLDIQLDANSPVGELVVIMMAGISQFENRRRAERQRAAFAVMRAKGQRCGGVPYGWAVAAICDRRNQDEQPEAAATELVPIAKEQRVLRQIMEWIEVEKLGVSTVSGLLNRAGTPTKKGGKKWFPATVQSVYDHRRLACGTGILPVNSKHSLEG